MARSNGRADLMLKTMGVKIVGSLGPRDINPSIRDALTINVKNQIASLTADTQKKLTESLINGVTAGKGPKAMAKDISEATGMERNRAVLIARTETMRANVSTSVDRFKRYGVQKLQWVATPDERECDECGAHDGQVYDIDDHPDCPAHPNCRCVLAPYIEEGGEA